MCVWGGGDERNDVGSKREKTKKTKKNDLLTADHLQVEHSSPAAAATAAASGKEEDGDSREAAGVAPREGDAAAEEAADGEEAPVRESSSTSAAEQAHPGAVGKDVPEDADVPQVLPGQLEAQSGEDRDGEVRADKVDRVGRGRGGRGGGGTARRPRPLPQRRP